jgi:hypothetical protein
MIKLFRNIRQNLLKEGKITNYLKYAIGEIVLVVIGILIALQINNWNDHRKEKAIEQQLLKALNEEFTNNLEILKQTIVFNDTIVAKIMALGEYTGPKLENFNERNISQLMVDAFKDDIVYNPIQGTINDIIYSGKLSVISNPRLREALSSWQSSLERVKDQEKFVNEIRKMENDYFLNNGNFRRHLNLLGAKNITPSRFPNNNFSFLEDQSYESNLYLCIVACEYLNERFYTDLKVAIELILEDTKKDLD